MKINGGLSLSKDLCDVLQQGSSVLALLGGSYYCSSHQMIYSRVILSFTKPLRFGDKCPPKKNKRCRFFRLGMPGKMIHHLPQNIKYGFKLLSSLNSQSFVIYSTTSAMRILLGNMCSSLSLVDCRKKMEQRGHSCKP